MSSVSDPKRSVKNDDSSFLGKEERFDSLEESSFHSVDQIPTDKNAEKG